MADQQQQQPLSADSLMKALKATQQLRASVSGVFNRLSNGMRGGGAGSGAYAGDSGDKEKAFLTEVRDGLGAVNTDVEALDKLSSSIPTHYALPSLGNPSLLSIDPFTDKTSLYGRVVHTYKWSTKLQSQAAFACQLLASGAPKRSLMTSPLGKRQRRNMANNLFYTQQQMEQYIQGYIRGWQDFGLKFGKPFGSLTVMQVTIGRTMKAVVVLRGAIIEWVIVKAFHEETYFDNEKLDLWSTSRYAVFDKVTSHARAAMMYYSSVNPEPTIRLFLGWLHSYRTLFSLPCHKCKKVLNEFSPPTFRDFRLMEPYHDCCRP
jgi:mediator of RNA polymerase II transcription subunit 27